MHWRQNFFAADWFPLFQTLDNIWSDEADYHSPCFLLFNLSLVFNGFQQTLLVTECYSNWFNLYILGMTNDHPHFNKLPLFHAKMSCRSFELNLSTHFECERQKKWVQIPIWEAKIFISVFASVIIINTPFRNYLSSSIYKTRFFCHIIYKVRI